MTTSHSTGTALQAGTWTADNAHSHIAFKVRHMGVGRVRGTADLTSATLVVGEDGIAGASVVAEIDAASISTGNAQRDAHIRSADFLDTETFPAITFRSTSVSDVDGEAFTLTGDLTLHGVTKQVQLAAEYAGQLTDAYGGERAGFTATTTLGRSEFGIDIQMAFGAGNAVVAEKIELELDLEFTLNA